VRAPTTPVPTSPVSPAPRRVRRPRWLDSRLIAGIVLVLVSVLVGARVVSAADKTESMWAAAHDLAPGSVLGAQDVTSVRVRLPDGSGHYLETTVPVLGKTVTRQLSAGELLPQSSLENSAPATTVTVPLATANAPKISRGQRIELWVTTKTCSAVAVLDSVTVQDVQAASGGAFASGSTQNVVVRLAPEHAQRLVTALALDGAVIRAGILDGPAPPNANLHLEPLDGCVTKR
jgi:Chaperone for flagella basal body P-ring formation